MINYGFTKELDIPYGRVIEQVREALKNEGFRILTVGAVVSMTTTFVVAVPMLE